MANTIAGTFVQLQTSAPRYYYGSYPTLYTYQRSYTPSAYMNSGHRWPLAYPGGQYYPHAYPYSRWPWRHWSSQKLRFQKKY